MKLEEFEELKRSSVGHSLIKAARLHNEFSFNTAKRKMGFSGLRPSHLQLFAHIPFDKGITVVDLAQKMEISKQAVSSMVKELLAAKMLVKKDNPEDKRSFLITLSQRKGAGIFEGMKVLKEMDREIEKLLGTEVTKRLARDLLKIVDAYESK